MSSDARFDSDVLLLSPLVVPVILDDIESKITGILLVAECHSVCGVLGEVSVADTEKREALFPKYFFEMKSFLPLV